MLSSFFYWITFLAIMNEGLDLLQFSIFNNSAYLKHGITVRSGGVSYDKYGSLNLSFACGDSMKNVTENRRRLASEIGVPANKLLFPNQCHTNQVVCAANSDVDTSETDALITNRKELAIGVLAADCVPILFFDPIHEVIGAAHSGWRGTVKNIVSKVLEKMKDEYNTNPAEVLVGIGPCIQADNYAVGNEVAREFKKLGKDIYESCVLQTNPTKWSVDLQGVNKSLLINSGVNESNIELIRLCTYSNSDKFFSARRDGFQSGRFGAVIMLK